MTQALPTPTPLGVGDLVAGRYEISHELGRGGMGIVYLCQDLATGDKVALKCVFVDRARVSSNEVIWFQQEARALAALDHPAIVHARDFGTLTDGSPYLVMDALHGRSIHVWKYLTTIPWPVIWTVIDQALGGLAHAHARGVIHGDLKPSNILVDPRQGVESPRAYILDLGLAWLLADRIDPRLEMNQPAAPTMPFGLGTPGWMAPEQIRRAAPHIGPPTDLYALGSILFELLTGREVFQGPSAEVLRLHRDQAPGEFQLREEVPAGVSGFVTTMLAKRPWHRFRFAADAREAWEAFRPVERIYWQAPNVRLSGEHGDAALLSLRPAAAPAERPAANLSPGILSLRSSPLVGRGEERDLLWRQVEQIVLEQGARQRLVLLRGQAGVGKSRLGEWLAEAVHERGLMTPLRARYRRVPGPYDGLHGAITAHYNLRGQSRDVIEQALLNEWEIEADDEQGRTWVAATATWLKPPTADEQAAIGPSGKRFFLDKPELRWVVIRHALERIAGTGRPVLLLLDDLHLASENTITGLSQLCREAPLLPLLMVATARDEALASMPAAEARLSALSRSMSGAVLRLSPLNEGETQALLRSSLPLAPEAEEVAIARSHGNPLFALQLVHAWASSGQLQLTGGRYQVPTEALEGRARTTAELWDERLAALDPGLRPAAYAAAALGEVLHLEGLIYLLTALGIDSTNSIRALQKAEILVVEQGARLRWPHALLQEHLFARLTAAPDAARVFHLAADALATHPEADSRRIIRQRVQNLQRAGEDEAAAQLLLDHVARTWTRVRDVAACRSDLLLLDGHVTGVTLAHALRWRAETERHLGNLEEARQLAEEARQQFEKLGDEDDEAHCLRLLANIASDQGAPALGRIEAVLAHAKFDALGDEEGKAECELLLGEIQYLLGDHTGAREHLANAARTFRKAVDPLRLAQGLILSAFVEQAAGRLDSARELLLQSRVEFDAIGYQLGLAQVDVTLGHVEHRAGELDAAYDRALTTLDRFRQLDNPRGEAACERLAAMAALDRGDTALAFQHALATFSLYDQRIADSWGRVEGAVLLAQVALAENAIERAHEHLALAESIAVDEAEPVQHRHLTVAWLDLLSHDPEGAAQEIAAAREAFAGGRRTGDHTSYLLSRLLGLSSGTAADPLLHDWLRFLESSPATSTPLPPAKSARRA